MPENKALTLLQNRTKAVKRLDRWYHRHIEPEATPAEQEKYTEITAAIRSILEKEAPRLAIADFRSDVLQAVFGVCEGDPRTNPMLDLSTDELVSIPGSLADQFIETVLAAYSRATPCSAENTRFIRSRLDAIHYLALGEMQRSPPRAAQYIDKVSFATGKQIAQNITYLKYQRNLTGIMDYTLWWGNGCDLETNLVVVVAKELGAASLSRGEALVGIG
jgi:hypothetical protein